MAQDTSGVDVNALFRKQAMWEQESGDKVPRTTAPAAAATVVYLSQRRLPLPACGLLLASGPLPSPIWLRRAWSMTWCVLSPAQPPRLVLTAV